MIKYASRFQLALYLQQGYDIIVWNKAKNHAGLYLKAKTFWVEHPGRSFRSGKAIRLRHKLAASGTVEELEALVREFSDRKDI